MSTEPTPPDAARWITRTLEDAGHETWAVGGAVRDSLLGRPSGDWDFATHAQPAEVRRTFRRTVPIGIEHGTVGVLARDGTLYEVTTFRRDVETDGRHAVVAFAETLEEDLARRDFTINAIAWHVLREELFDPFDGAGDLDRRVLRTVGDASERFREDYLRVLRALRFAGQFGLEIEKDTWASLCALVSHLADLSAERIREELLKILSGAPEPTAALELYAEAGVLAVLYPELEEVRSREAVELRGGDDPATIGVRSEWAVSVASASRLPIGRPMLRLTALLRGVTAEAGAALLMRLRLSNNQMDEVARLAAAEKLPDASESDHVFRSWLSRHGTSRLSAVARLELARAKAVRDLGFGHREHQVVESWRRARLVRAAAPPLTVSELELDGRGLIALGLKPGPHFGHILKELLIWVLEDPSRNRRETLEGRVPSIVEEVAGG